MCVHPNQRLLGCPPFLSSPSSPKVASPTHSRSGIQLGTRFLRSFLRQSIALSFVIDSVRCRCNFFPTRSHFANRIPSLFQDSNLSETNLPRSQHPHWRRAAFTLCFLLFFYFEQTPRPGPFCSLVRHSRLDSRLSDSVSPSLSAELSSGFQPSLSLFSTCPQPLLRTTSSLCSPCIVFLWDKLLKDTILTSSSLASGRPYVASLLKQSLPRARRFAFDPQPNVAVSRSCTVDDVQRQTCLAQPFPGPRQRQASLTIKRRPFDQP